MDNEKVEINDEEVVERTTPEEPAKKEGQGEISAITEITNHGSYGKLEVSTTINNETKQFINAYSGQENEAVDFVLFKQSGTTEVIPGFSVGSLKQFQESRIMVVNYADKLHQLALTAVENAVFAQGLKHDFKPVCCSLYHQHTVSLSKLLRAVVEDKLFSPKEQQVLIVFEQRPEDTSDGFIAQIKEKSGAANIITESLKDRRLYLVYVCQNNALFEIRPQAQTHFGLYFIDPYINAFFGIKKNAEDAMTEYTAAMSTMRMTGWLSDFSEEFKLEHLSELSSTNKLLEEAAAQLKSIDKIKESRMVNELLAQPLQNIIFFILTFFEGISLPEFDQLVRDLLLNMPAIQNSNSPGDVLTNTLWDWNTSSDHTLIACGVYLDNSADKKIPAYRFVMDIRANIVGDMIRGRHRLALARRCEFIEEKLIAQPLAYSKVFAERWFKLFFETAALDPQRYLLRFALRLTALIGDDDANAHSQDEKTRLLSMLIDFIGYWEDNTQLSPVINRFYDEMRKTADKRMLLGTILAYYCAPEKPQMLNRLKAYLDSISREENHFNLDVINSISFNYLDKIPQLLDTVIQWAELGTGTPPRSVSHVRCAYLLLFYNQWQFATKKANLSYRILKQLVNTSDGLAQLAYFVFGTGSAEAFKLLYTDNYRQKYAAEPQLNSTMASHLYLMQAFVLVQWHYLLMLIRLEDEGTPWEVNTLMLPCIRQIIGWGDAGRLRSAVGRAKILLNYEIEEKMEDRVHYKAVQLLRQKRDGARELLKLI